MANEDKQREVPEYLREYIVDGGMDAYQGLWGQPYFVELAIIRGVAEALKRPLTIGEANAALTATVLQWEIDKKGAGGDALT